MDVGLSICIAEAKHAAEQVPREDVVAQLKAAMKQTWRHWMVTSEDVQLRGAIGGVLLLAHERGDTEVEQRLAREVKLLQALAAAMSGIPVDFEQLLGSEDEPRPECYGVTKLWQEIKGQR
jgi:hypothetical protein